jgi:MoaA/NifB/PqqE/SkfB family radical SAM enzyme
MKPRLSPNFRLIIRSNRAYVERRRDAQVVAALSPLESLLLGMMDGKRSESEICDLLRAAGRPDVAAALSKLQLRLGPLISSAGPPSVDFDLKTLARVQDVDPREGLRRLPGPRVLHWWVTAYCPKRCVYCFANPILGSRAKDAILSRSQLQTIFVEAAELGAQRLLVAGAEPLLRQDLPEVLGDAIGAGILPLLTTKHSIDRALAERFAAAGLRHLSLSIDSVDSQENQRLVGNPNYACHVAETMEALQYAGIEFSLQMVVTPVNQHSLRKVVDFAATRRARVVQVVPYEPVQSPIGDYGNYEMLVERSAVASEVETLQCKYPTIELELFEELGSGSSDAYQCDIGMTKMFFLPDGVVHRCYKLTADDRLRGRDLRVTSVAAAWHDPAFQPIISPPRQNYAGTACFGCGRFQSCHDEGRCIYQALVDLERYEAPDRDCDGPYGFDLKVLN